MPQTGSMAAAAAAGSGSFCLFRLQEFFRLGFETLAAARRAEKIVLLLVGEAVLGGRRVDPHAADRIDGGRYGRVSVAVVSAAAAAGGDLRLRRPRIMAGVSRAMPSA